MKKKSWRRGARRDGVVSLDQKCAFGALSRSMDRVAQVPQLCEDRLHGAAPCDFAG